MKPVDDLALQATAAEEEAPEELEQYLIFEVRGGAYGVDILQTQEVLKPIAATRIPNTPEEVLGVINLRGNIVPVIDLGRKLGHDFTVIEASSRIIVCTFSKKLVGLLVDRVLETAQIPASSIESSEVRGLSGDTVIGAGRSGSRVFLLMNPAAVFVDD